MIEFVFTIDYEIYGNGFGDLRTHVYEPARKLQSVFGRAGARFVNFVEAPEFLQIERHRTDPAIVDVRRHIRELYEQGHEIGLHLHPQWANAEFQNGRWMLDYSEYNLCVLPRDRVARIVDDAIAWIRDVIADDQFTPLSFRAGNWLFQPTKTAGEILAARGVKIDSSVFKGGVQHQHGLNYCPARRNGWHWRFSDDVNVPDPFGDLLELPIYTEMVPFWRMLTGKRVSLQQRSHTTPPSCPGSGAPSGRVSRLRDYLRPLYPMKLDFCRMTLAEMTTMVERVMRVDAASPAVLKPLVAIGHTKDLVDFATVEAFLAWLKERSIPVTTLASAYDRCQLTANVPQAVVWQSRSC